MRRALRAPAVLLARALVRGHVFGGYQRRLLSTWHTTELRGLVGRALFGALFEEWLTREYWPEPDPDRREALKELCMAGASGTSWAHEYDERPLEATERMGSLSLFEAWPVYPAVERLLSRLERPAHVVQIGSSSGREVAWVAERFPDVDCIGTDVYEEVVAWARSHHQAPNVSFSRFSAKQLPSLLLTLNGTVVLFDSGSLQYVQPEHLGRLFEALAARPKSFAVVADPVSTADGDPLTLGGSRPRANFSYTHDYAHYAEAAGMRTVVRQLIRPYPEHDPQASTAHYFWAGCAPGSASQMEKALLAS